MQDLCQKLEAAGKALLESVGVSVDESDVAILTGLGNDIKTLPCAILVGQGGPEMPQGSGNFMVSFSVEFRTNAADTSIEQHRAATATVLGVFMSDDLANELVTDDFGVFGIQNRQAGGSRIEDGQWVSELSMDVYCCGLTLTA